MNIPTKAHEIDDLMQQMYPLKHANNRQHPFDVKRIRHDFPILSSHVLGNPLVWLDNGSTTQKPKNTIESISNYYQHENSNVHRGNHTLAKRATAKFDYVRQQVADFIHARSANEIVFVRGATEAINLVAASFGKKYIQAGDEVIVTILEHHSNILPWQVLCQEKGAVLRVAPIDHNGEIILDEYEALFNQKTKIVAFTHISNLLGTLMPVKEMTAIAHRHGAAVLIDGAQAVAHVSVNVQELDCDFYVFSGHKMFGPTVIGVLYGKLDWLNDLPPWQVGGGMIKHVSFTRTEYADVPGKFEAGTVHLAGVIGLGATLDYLKQIDVTCAFDYEKSLMIYALNALQTVPGLELLGHPKERVGAIPFKLAGIDDDQLGKHLDDLGIAMRIGHHCAQPALAFFGYKTVARPAIAFYNTRHEIDELINGLHFNKRKNQYDKRLHGKYSRII